MSPVWANQTQDKLGSAPPQPCHRPDCLYLRDRPIMGTLFEPASGGFAPMYSPDSFFSFGPPVGFESGYSQLDDMENDPKHNNCETLLHSELPDLSSQSSSPYSSRPSSFHSESQDPFISIPDQEPYNFSLELLWNEVPSSLQRQNIWSGLNDALPPFPGRYSLAIPALISDESNDSLVLPLERLYHGKKAASDYAINSRVDFALQSYPHISTEPRLFSGQSDLVREAALTSFGNNLIRPDRCPCPLCKKSFKDLKAHPLTHVKERPEKCPVNSCQYSVKGFCRKYDKHRHTLTHYIGTMICTFCPVEAAKTFHRVDVFKRHLTSVHGAECASLPSSRKSSKSRSFKSLTEPITQFSFTAKAVCSICLVSFGTVQSFYNHLDDCVLRCVLQQISESDVSPVCKAIIRPDENNDTGISANSYPNGVSESEMQFRDVTPFSADHKHVSPSLPQIKRRASVMLKLSNIETLKEEESKPGTKCPDPCFPDLLNAVSIPYKRKSCSLTGDISAKQMKLEHHLNMVREKNPNERSESSNDFKAPINLAEYIRSQEKGESQQEDFIFRQWLEDFTWEDLSLSFIDPIPSSMLATGHLDMQCFSMPSIEPTKKSCVISGGLSRVETPEKKSTNTSEELSPDPGRFPPLFIEEEGENTVSCKEKTISQVIKEEDDMVLVSPYDPKPTMLDSLTEESENLAPSPETELSKDTSDVESISDCSTDWGDDQLAGIPEFDIYRILQGVPNDHTEGNKTSLRPLLTPMKQDLVDRIMTEFWSIINQEWAANLTKCAGETPSSSSPPGSNGGLISGLSPQMTHRKRQRDDEEDTPPNDNSGHNPKRPNSQSEKALPKSGNNLACPYRKHAPHKYTIYNHRSCALSHWDSVARVKEHLYRRHRVPIQCKRCWHTFKSGTALDDHLTVVNICELKTGQPAEGLTPDQEKRLKSRKKSTPDQSEEARWKDIYGILFPNEVIPNPYFEPVQENSPQSPDSRDLANYEEYSRQELPRYFRSYLENAVNNQTQHLEEDLRSQLVSIVQDCQTRMFSDYRSRVANSGSKSSRNNPANEICTPPILQGMGDETINTVEHESKDIVSSVFAPTPETTSQNVPNLRDLATNIKSSPQHTTTISFSDSAYSSCPSSSQPAAKTKTSDNLCDNYSFGDGGEDGEVLHELSFEEYCMDQDFGFWTNLDHKD